jgi:hypothetical protein
VPLKGYDATLRTPRNAVERAKLGNDDKLAALARLDARARSLEHATGPDFDEFLARERERSHELGGRSVFART